MIDEKIKTLIETDARIICNDVNLLFEITRLMSETFNKGKPLAPPCYLETIRWQNNLRKYYANKKQ